MKKGFTLIELLVVLSIISLLSSIGLAAINSARAKARDVKRVSDLRQVKNAMLLCYDKQGSYLITAETIITTPGTREPLTDSDWVSGWQTRCGEFLTQFPVDPSNFSYAVHTSNDYQHFVLLGRMETSAYSMTSAQITSFLADKNINPAWVPASTFNYIIGD